MVKKEVPREKLSIPTYAFYYSCHEVFLSSGNRTGSGDKSQQLSALNYLQKSWTAWLILYFELNEKKKNKKRKVLWLH